MSKEKMNLVIVESPAKAKTIEKYLGGGYKVTASMGHLRDLPKSKLGVDVDNGFLPDYQPVKGREDTIKALKTAAKGADKIYLATDPDREGEAISWHIKEMLGLKNESAYRVTFNEITKKVVQDSIAHPRAIDEDLVNAQQTRRILDRIVGYKLSPLLWKKIRRGLSAGRVQSVATRMVVDREEEIRAFTPEEYWLLDALLETETGAGKFKARFNGTVAKKAELHSAQETETVKSAVKNAPFSVHDVKRTDKKRSPAPPFITSTLQQESSRKLGMTPRRTMQNAQNLYEGIDIEGEGTVGLITYMRTDSLRLSEEALADAKNFILSQYGEPYFPGNSTHFKSKSSAQDAHEAIRPSNVFLTPDKIRKSLSSDQYRLYKLIWSRFLASQMSAAIFDSVTVDAQSANYIFRANTTSIKFPGFMAVYIEGQDEENEENSSPLPELKAGDPLKLLELIDEQKFTQPPARYTEATLIKAMEDTGVGRPSTYAPTVSTIIDREYVVKEGKNLRPTPLGEVVTGLMKERFGDIVDLGFTARMEETLDSVEKGKAGWQSVLKDFYDLFSKELADAEKALDGERIKVPPEYSDEVCDTCGKQMVIKSGRFGRFLGCSGYPDCTFTKPIVIEMPGKCPKCGSRILKRTSKNGYAYFACEKLNKGCDFLTWDSPVKENCPECGQTLFKKTGRGFKKPFCINDKCPNFLPEDQRGYKKKTSETPAETSEPSSVGDAALGAPLSRKSATSTKKSATKKTTTPAKKPAAKKTTTAKKPKTTGTKK